MCCNSLANLAKPVFSRRGRLSSLTSFSYAWTHSEFSARSLFQTWTHYTIAFINFQYGDVQVF